MLLYDRKSKSCKKEVQDLLQVLTIAIAKAIQSTRCKVQLFFKFGNENVSIKFSLSWTLNQADINILYVHFLPKKSFQ